MIRVQFEKNKAVAYDEEKIIGECEFIESNDTWNIIHTGVDNSYQGQGIAKRLVECVILASKELNKNVIADCSYAKKVIEKTKEGL